MNFNAKLTIYLALSASLAGCVTTKPVVKYGDAKAVETVTAEFGSTDLQQIGEAMTRSLLQSRVVAGAYEPVIITMAPVKNKTRDYIDTVTITDKIRTQLTRSGLVRFGVSISEMQGQVDELKRQNQTGLYAKSTQSRMGNMQGARYRLEGAISDIKKTTKDVQDVFYIFNLNLVNNETGLIEWADEKEIRKTTTR
jgi:penicillin-binding protein activator